MTAPDEQRDPEWTTDSSASSYVATHRAFDEVAKARESGIEEGRAQMWDRLAWLVPAVLIVGFIAGLALGLYWKG